MTKTFTRSEVEALIEAYEAAALAQVKERTDDADAAFEAASVALATIAGAGSPASESYAESLGPDYICSLDDGTIVAHGADRSIWPGRSIRETIFIAPGDQA